MSCCYIACICPSVSSRCFRRAESLTKFASCLAVDVRKSCHIVRRRTNFAAAHCCFNVKSSTDVKLCILCSVSGLMADTIQDHRECLQGTRTIRRHHTSRTAASIPRDSRYVCVRMIRSFWRHRRHGRAPKRRLPHSVVRNYLQALSYANLSVGQFARLPKSLSFYWLYRINGKLHFALNRQLNSFGFRKALRVDLQRVGVIIRRPQYL